MIDNNTPIFRLKYLALIIGIVCIAISCARLGNPQGGPRDTEAPIILDEHSTQNFQTNFTDKEIVLEFNEWIKLNNPTKEIVVSPPTNYPIETSIKGKGVFVKFSEDEMLRENTTYQINFGDAISDFTENNVYKNLIFVFSTGDVIDSLSVKGSVKDVLSQKGEENIIVMLYDDLSDTCFAKNKPLYFSKTDKEGNFELNNLRSDTFQIFALADANVNYIYDQITERVGFLDSLIFLNDSSNYQLQLELFDEVDPPRVIEYKQELKGLIKVVYNPIPENPIVTNSNSDTLISEIKKDTLLIWHTDLAIDTNLFFIQYDQTIDTIKNKKARKSTLEQSFKLASTQKNRLTVYEGDSIILNFNKPILKVDTSLISIKDSFDTFKIDAYKISNKRLELTARNLQPDSTYFLTIEDKACTDIFNATLSDTLEFNISMKSNSTRGTVLLSIINENVNNYILELMSGSTVIEKHSISASKDLKFSKLESGSYNLKITEDINGDGRWSPGSLKEKRQSERIKEVPLEELKAGWEINMDININQIFDGAEGK